MNLKESLKSLAVALLFICAVTLAAVYISNTQRLTLESESAVDINRLLVIRSGGGEITEYDRSLVMPEAVCIGYGGEMYGCFSDIGTVSDVYSILTPTLTSLLGPDSVSEICYEDEAASLWQKCLTAENFIYIKYHTPLPSPVIYAGLRGGTVSTPPEYAAGDPANICELFILLENPDGSEYEYSAAARDSDGNIVRYDLRNSRGVYFDIAELSGYNGSRSFVKCGFAANTKGDYNYPLGFSSTAIMTDAKLSSQLITVNRAQTDGISYRLLRLFGFNPDRLNEYRESTGAVVYVETDATLRHSKTSIHYAASDSSAGIDAADLLGYENYSGDYNVYELLCASGELIRRIKAIDPMLCGGDASMLLTDIGYSNGSITVGFGITWSGVRLYSTEYEPIRSLEVTFTDGCITDVVISTVSVTGTASTIVCFPQKWMLDKLSQRLADDALMSKSIDMELAYMIRETSDEQAAFSADWVLVY